MKTKHLLLVTITALLVLSTTSCVLKKSTPPPQPTANPTEQALFPEPVTETSLEILSALVTPTVGSDEGNPIDLTPSAFDLTPIALDSQGTPQSGTPAVATLQPLVSGTQAGQTPMVLNIPTFTPGPLPTSYTLQQGEFPYCIARRFDISVGALLTLNGLNSNSKPAAGVTLQIPQDGVTFGAARALHTHPSTYTVKTNDTIYSVACYYGDVNPLVIAQVNNLQPPYTLTAGQTLSIP